MAQRLTRNEILEWWNSQSYRVVTKDPDDIIHLAAHHFHVPEEVIRKQLGDWEAGR